MLDFVPLLGNVLDKIFPDPIKSQEAKLKLMELQQNGDLKELEASLQRDVAQIELNRVEAQSDDKFKSRWRPAVGWICVFGLAYSAILYPLLTWFAVIYGIASPPNLGMEVLMPVLLGMLGLGGMRSFEKYKGVTK